MSIWDTIIGMFTGSEPEPSFQSARSGRVVDSANTNRYTQPTTGRSVASYQSGSGGRNVGGYNSGSTGQTVLAYGARPGMQPMVNTRPNSMSMPQYSPLASMKGDSRSMWDEYLQSRVPGYGDVGRELGALLSPTHASIPEWLRPR